MPATGRCYGRRRPRGGRTLRRSRSTRSRWARASGTEGGDGVAGQLDVTQAGDQLPSGGPGNLDLALPVDRAGAGSRIQLLVRHYRANVELQLLVRDRHPPGDGVGRAAPHARPVIERFDRVATLRQVDDLAVGADERAEVGRVADILDAAQ